MSIRDTPFDYMDMIEERGMWLHAMSLFHDSVLINIQKPITMLNWVRKVWAETTESERTKFMMMAEKSWEPVFGKRVQ